jgi:hypothetical protein
MKRFFISKTEKSDLSGIEYLTSNELFYVRGGSDIKPATRPKDILDLETED